MVSLYMIVGLANRNTCFTWHWCEFFYFPYVPAVQCGITLDELQHKYPHAVNVNSSQGRQVVSPTGSRTVESESDNEISAVEEDS